MSPRNESSNRMKQPNDKQNVSWGFLQSLQYNKVPQAGNVGSNLSAANLEWGLTLFYGPYFQEDIFMIAVIISMEKNKENFPVKRKSQ